MLAQSSGELRIESDCVRIRLRLSVPILGSACDEKVSNGDLEPLDFSHDREHGRADRLAACFRQKGCTKEAGRLAATAQHEACQPSPRPCGKRLAPTLDLRSLQYAADIRLLQPQNEQVGTGAADSTTAASAAEESAAQGTAVQARDGADDAGSDDSALPITHEVVMKDHTKVGNARIPGESEGRKTAHVPSCEQQTVSALSIDPAGARVVSGSYDYDCKLWDFGGMNANFKPFRSFECKPGHQVRALPSFALDALH